VIPAVSRGGRMRGLLRYLVGPGHDGEHRAPHLVAGERVELWEGVQLDAWAADEIAKQLDASRLRSRVRVTVPRKGQDGAVLVDDRGRPVRADAHVWHCSLSLHPDEDALSDEKWSEIAGEFIERMGFGEQRWVAIRHGLTKNGGDHVHLVVQLVGEDGRSAGVHNDRPRAQEACRQLERGHGLRLVEGRDRKRGARATKYQQRYRAQEQHRKGLTGSPEPDREVLERMVRRLAAASAGEGEFVRRLRGEGLMVRPRFAASRDDQVIGYSVGLAPAGGQLAVPHSGGRLAKDLTLPRLRAGHGWIAEEPDAIGEWRRAFHGQDPGTGPESNPWVGRPSWDDALRQLRDLRDSATSLPPEARGAWAQTAAHGAAILYGWAELAGVHAPALRQLGRELALSAEIRAADAQLDRPLPHPRSVALLCAAMMRPQNQTLFWLVLAQELQALTIAIRDMHQAAGEAQRATALASAIRGELAPLTAQLDDEHAAVDRDYGETRDALRLARAGQAPVTDIARPPSPDHPAATPSPPHRPQRKPGRGPR
jgi:Relaxase/Mobilisation nuclease domain